MRPAALAPTGPSCWRGGIGQDYAVRKRSTTVCRSAGKNRVRVGGGRPPLLGGDSRGWGGRWRTIRGRLGGLGYGSATAFVREFVGARAASAFRCSQGRGRQPGSG